MLHALVLAILPQVYQTYIRPRFEAFGWSGTLTLYVNNGDVTGTYRPDSGSPLTQSVIGHRDGTHIWLDISTLGGLKINGTIKNGAISGLGTSPEKAGAYIFIATPNVSH